MEPPFHIHSIVKKARCDRLPSVQESAQARQSVSSPASESESESESESVRVWFFFFVLSFVEGEAVGVQGKSGNRPEDQGIHNTWFS